jgi:predicted porin
VLAYGVVGYSRNDFTSPGGDSSGEGANYGLGLDYRMTEDLRLGAEFLERNMRNPDESGVSGLDAKVQTLSLRLGYSF